MKATELMIGDWVSVEDLIRCRVDKIFQDYVVCLDKRDNEIIVNIMPIPITVEIIEKNGFGIDDSFKPHLLWRSADNRIILHNDDEYLNTFNKWHVHVDTEDMRTIGSIELTYVHQFQQFLRLCGMNELADNFKI